MRFEAVTPTHEELTGELVRLRVSGLVQLRQATVPTLRRSAALVAAPSRADDHPAAIEALLRSAVARLGGGRLGEAAEFTYGLVQGTRDWPAADRRRRSAEVYRVSVDRFRKHYERIVHEQTAEAILGLIRDSAGVPARRLAGASNLDEPSAGSAISPAHPANGADRGDGEATTAGWDTGVRDLLVTRQGRTVPVSVHHTSVDMLSGIDVVVCPLNTYLELANTYKRSVAACLRLAGADRGPAGEIVSDCVSRALDRWRARYARPGLPVAPGTIAATPIEPGCGLAFRRIYHAAVATPRADSNDYHVDPAAVARAVHNVFRVAAGERDMFRPPLTSLCFPLLGAGRGGLTARTSFSWIWEAALAELVAGPHWRMHFVAIRRSDADTVHSMLLEQGAAEVTEGGP
ncbi:hypothetical protein ACPXB5_20810 [Micromonospora arida]|uniref:hypothetical protein n=1 Tax=Micromonospora arida TaxID=2203715 RepID=UPI003CEC602B